jgi:hypothetical protein|eukprot:COSAG01_NODE_798_length_13503_cov_8.878395_20_plen_192_part_00
MWTTLLWVAVDGECKTTGARRERLCVVSPCSTKLTRMRLSIRSSSRKQRLQILLWSVVPSTRRCRHTCHQDTPRTHHSLQRSALVVRLHRAPSCAFSFADSLAASTLRIIADVVPCGGASIPSLWIADRRSSYKAEHARRAQVPINRPHFMITQQSSAPLLAGSHPQQRDQISSSRAVFLVTSGSSGTSSR